MDSFKEEGLFEADFNFKNILLKQIYFPNGSISEIHSKMKAYFEIIDYLKHPKLLNYYGYFLEDNKNVYLISEYFKGGSLFDNLHNRGIQWSTRQK